MDLHEGDTVVLTPRKARVFAACLCGIGTLRAAQKPYFRCCFGPNDGAKIFIKIG